MKATKKQITAVAEIAAEKGLNINAVISMFDNCSASTYNAIGAEGFVNCFAKAAQMTAANEKGGIDFNLCEVVASTEKAFLISFTDPKSVKAVEKWVAKSVIANDIVPFWAIK